MADETLTESPNGGTAWRKFAYVALPGLVAAGVLGAATTQGLLAASFAVSGDNFKISASHLEGTGFAQYGDVATSVDKTSRPVGLSIIEEAELSDMCMSALLDLPIGKATLLIRAGRKPPSPRPTWSSTSNSSTATPTSPLSRSAATPAP